MGEIVGRGPGYRVRILYSEPEFRRRNPQCPKYYSSQFDVPKAATPDVAVREAIARFDESFRLSGVGWVRVIRSITVER